MHLNWKKEIFTIPNLLSLFRILLIPVYIRLYLRAYTDPDYFLAGSILALSCITDALDGTIARKYNMISHLGKLLDPLADKLTQFAMILCLSFRHPVLNPVLVLFLTKEVFQILAMVLNLRKGKALPGALMAGKVCTCVLFISLIFLVALPNLPQWTVDLTALVNTGFLSFSLVCYVLAYYGKHKAVEDFRCE